VILKKHLGGLHSLPLPRPSNPFKDSVRSTGEKAGSPQVDELGVMSLVLKQFWEGRVNVHLKRESFYLLRDLGRLILLRDLI
jgi:hypothetical protein